MAACQRPRLGGGGFAESIGEAVARLAEAAALQAAAREGVARATMAGEGRRCDVLCHAVFLMVRVRSAMGPRAHVGEVETTWQGIVAFLTARGGWG